MSATSYVTTGRLLLVLSWIFSRCDDDEDPPLRGGNKERTCLLAAHGCLLDPRLLTHHKLSASKIKRPAKELPTGKDLIFDFSCTERYCKETNTRPACKGSTRPGCFPREQQQFRNNVGCCQQQTNLPLRTGDLRFTTQQIIMCRMNNGKPASSSVWEGNDSLRASLRCSGASAKASAAPSVVKPLYDPGWVGSSS